MTKSLFVGEPHNRTSVEASLPSICSEIRRFRGSWGLEHRSMGTSRVRTRQDEREIIEIIVELTVKLRVLAA